MAIPIAIVTGAAQGIGKAIALRLADDGLDVAVNDLDSQREKLKSVAKEIEQKGRRSLAFCADISTEDGVKDLISHVVTNFGGLDVMVANAGIVRMNSILEASVEEWDLLMRVNARGTFLQYKYAAEQLVKQGRGGRIIGACSMSGKRGLPLLGAYGATKFAIRGLTQTAAQELAKYNITVNAYAPGGIKTGIVASVEDGDRGVMAAAKEKIGFSLDMPMGETEDIAGLVSYLAGPESRFMTGQSICIDGGIHFDLVALRSTLSSSRPVLVPSLMQQDQNAATDRKVSHMKETMTSTSMHVATRSILSPFISSLSKRGLFMSTTTRIAIVTGAAQGIGRTIALRLADDGLDVAVNDLGSQSEKLNEVVEEIQQKGRRSSAVFADISTEEGVKRLVARVVEEFGGLDVMIANAGIAAFGTILDTTVEDWDRVMSVNARGTYLLYKFAAEQMVKQGRGGRIIGAASMAGKRGFPNILAYVASKFAIRGITQTAAQELGKYGITVNTYAPGLINTDMAIDPENFDRGPGAAAKVKLNLPAEAPLGATEDVAGLVSYLVRPEAHFITGQSISVDGGIVFS